MNISRLSAAMALVMAGLAAAGQAARAAPAQVIIIRHAEKPDSGNELSPKGFQRAGALVAFFEHNPAVTKYGTPAAIYAMDPKDETGSLRPIQTVTPLAQSLGLAINSNFKKKQLAGLVQDIMNNPDYAGRMVLICWEHKVIPELVQDFGWAPASGSWPGDVFDRAWILNFSSGQAASFADIPENVLPGDSAD